MLHNCRSTPARLKTLFSYHSLAFVPFRTKHRCRYPACLFNRQVKTTMRINHLLAICGAAALCLGTAGYNATGAANSASQTPAPPVLSAHDKQIVEAFEKRAKEYAKMREQLEGQMPK